jgi:Transcriptional regulator
MLMQMHHVRYFLALCEERNFTRAAKRCGVSQPSLTNAIKRLEQILGGQLFHRGRRNIELSELGRVVKPYLKQLDQSAHEAKRKATDFTSLNLELKSQTAMETPMRKSLYLVVIIAIAVFSLAFIGKSTILSTENSLPQSSAKIHIYELHKSIDMKALPVDEANNAI